MKVNKALDNKIIYKWKAKKKLFICFFKHIISLLIVFAVGEEILTIIFTK